MTSLFGLPIIVSIILGMVFPYAAISLAPFSLIFLVILMISAGLAIDWSKTVLLITRIREIGIAMVFAFVVYPIMLWIPAQMLIDDQQILYGFVFSSLSPIAMVAPYFSRLHQADPEFSMLLVIASMILCPILAPVLLAVLFSTSVSLNLLPLTRYMLLLITVPLLVSAIIASYLPKIRQQITRYEGYTNSITLSLLIFALFGTAASKLNINYIGTLEVASLLILVFLQDFGVLFISRYLLRNLLRPDTARALTIAVSMKNVAITAGVLLIYDPRASFAPALAFIAHAFLFSFLANPRLSGWVLGRQDQ